MSFDFEQYLNYQEQREDRSQVRNGNPTSDSSKKNNNYRDNYSSKRESASVESKPGNSSDIQRRSDTVQSQNSYGLENSTPSSEESEVGFPFLTWLLSSLCSW